MPRVSLLLGYTTRTTFPALPLVPEILSAGVNALRSLIMVQTGLRNQRRLDLLQLMLGRGCRATHSIRGLLLYAPWC